MNRLLEIGFIKVGYWELRNSKLTYTLDPSYSDVKNNLYAFVCDGEIKYVGKTTRLLKHRMYNYSMPGDRQSTNIKNNSNIIKHLSNDEAVDILVLPDNGLMHYGQFHLNLAAALEDNIIKIIQPEWNGYQLKNTIETNVVDIDIDIDTPTEQDATFTIHHFNMANTYWQRGFFNVSVSSSSQFGEDGTVIKIINRKTDTKLTAIINRTANTNKTPRIMGGPDLKQFFQTHFHINDTVTYRMLSLTTMEII